MFAKVKLFVFVVSLLGFSLSSCQKDELYTPEGPEPIVKVETGNYLEIVDPDDDDEDEDGDSKDEDREN
jgi:hypothetical protein